MHHFSNIFFDLSINDNSYSGMKDMGKVMSEIKSLPNASQIDGKISSKIVKEMLG